MLENNNSIPCIDLRPFVNKSELGERKAAAKKMREACIESGFFYVNNHGIKDPEKVIRSAKKFFALPSVEKERLAAVKNPLFRGYISKEAGHHTCNVKQSQSPDEKESYTIGAEISNNNTPMHGENSWPNSEETPSLKNVDDWMTDVKDYWDALLKLSRSIAACLALSLGINEQYFDSALSDPCAQMVMLRYFIEDFGEDRQRTGCGPHTDCGFLTILLQETGTHGLQVKTNNKQLTESDDEYYWVDVPAIPGTFVVNLGDMAQYWSGGLYKSTLHRVLIKNKAKSALSSLERYSVPFFCNCNFETPIDIGGLLKQGNENTERGENEDSLEKKMQEASNETQLTAGIYIMQRLGLMRKDKNKS